MPVWRLETKQEKLKRISRYTWSWWFAWYPVVVRYPGARYLTWLREIERRLVKTTMVNETHNIKFKYEWKYRFPKD